jgi:hypothetical protein
MEHVVLTVRTYLEIVYFLSGAVLAVAALMALRQVSLMKLDMLARSERAAKEKAIEAAFEYARAVASLSQHVKLLGKDVPPYYTGPIGDFTVNSVPPESREMANKRRSRGAMTIPLDLLDAIAAMFVTGVADEKTAFPIFGGAFCASVAGQYDIICVANSERPYAPLT